jgi:hypothetical protein
VHLALGHRFPRFRSCGDGPAEQHAHRVAAIGGGSADVVNRGERGQVVVEDGIEVAGGADEGLFQRGEALGSGGAGANGDARSGDAVVGVACDDGGDAGDGDDEVAAGVEFQEGGVGGIVGARDAETEQQFVRAAGGLGGPRRKSCRGSVRVPVVLARTTVASRASRKGMPSAAGLALQTLPNVLDLAAADLAGGLFQGIE